MSEIRATTISNAAGTGPIALTSQRAMVFFADYDLTANLIKDSLNSSSATDQGTGIFYISYSNNLANTSYAKYGTAGKASGAGSSTNSGMLDCLERSDNNANSFRGQVYNLAGSRRDSDKIGVGAIGDLA